MVSRNEAAWMGAGAVAGFLLLVFGWFVGRRSGKKKS